MGKDFDRESGSNSALLAERDALATACLGHLASDPGQLERFLNHVGLSPDGLREALGSPDLASGLLDYFVANEDLLLAMSANAGFRADRIMHVWQHLNRTE